MRIPDPKANTTTEAYLAYKAGYLEQSELKPVLYEPYLHFDGWLAYWAGLVGTYPNKGAGGKNLFNPALFDGITAGANGGYVSSKYYSASTEVTFNLKPNTDYILSLRDENYDLSGTAWSVAIDGTWKNVSSGSLVITTGSSGQFILKIGASSYSNIGTSERFIQLEEGSSATSYEPYYAEPEMLCDEEALVAYLSGVTDTYPEDIKDPYDVRIVGYLKHLASIRWPEPDYPVNNEEFYLSTMEPTHTSNPVPSSDIELDTAEGKIISVEAYGDTFQQTYSGKNLFDATTQANSSYVLSDGAITVTKNWGSNGRVYMNNMNLVAGTYTLSYYASLSGDTKEMRLSIVNNTTSSDIVNTTVSDIDGSRKSYTFTLANESSIKLCLMPNNSGGGTLTLTQIQLETGSATTYEPYVGGTASPNPDYPQDIQVVTGEQTVTISDGTNSEDFTINLGSTELCKIGTYQDYIYKSGDDWYVHKEVGKAELDGTESWSVTNSGQSNWFYIANIYSKLESISTPYPFYQWALSDHYTNAYISSNDVQGFNIIAATNVTNIRIREKTEDTTTNFKTWLASNRPLIYAPLATATDTKITDSTLIGQLDALAGADTYNKKTYIKVTATDPNLPALLKVEAYKY